MIKRIKAWLFPKAQEPYYHGPPNRMDQWDEMNAELARISAYLPYLKDAAKNRRQGQCAAYLGEIEAGMERLQKLYQKNRET